MMHLFMDALRDYCPTPSIILDIGSRDCVESAVFKEHFPAARIIAFEANPAHFATCRGKGIELVEKAVTDYDGDTDFYAIKPGTNSGASSLYEPIGAILPWDPLPISEKITVPCTRIDTWAKENTIGKVDAVWMDVQGAELKVLEGFSSLLDGVSVVATEVETTPVYHGNPTQLDQLTAFMERKGFEQVKFIQAWEKEADVLYVRKRLL